MANRNTKFWKRVVEYQVFNGLIVREALSKTKVDFPDTEQEASDNYGHRQVNSFELLKYKESLYIALDKIKDVIIKTVNDNER